MEISHRLDDDAVREFLTHGYLTLNPPMTEGFAAHVHAECERLTDEGNPGNGIYEAIPRLGELLEHAEVRGALESLLGPGYVMHRHRHLHTTVPGFSGFHWHQDDVNMRHHQIWRLLVMYYPHEVTHDMGPTIVLPGTHFRNAPTSRMNSYTNFRGQVALTVPAGTVAITHYDIWHTRTRNRTHGNRHMLKFIFDRTAVPTAPSWNHDPAQDERIRGDLVHTRFDHDGSSDTYKLVSLRLKAWNWMLSGAPEPAPGTADEPTVISNYR